jgi:2'-hydroxyisoflavone reductase
LAEKLLLLFAINFNNYKIRTVGGWGMRILILGGTEFLGRHLVEASEAYGHKVTLFNRGKTNPDLFPSVEKIIGDRDGNLEALKDRDWDVVIDTSGYVPRVVRESCSMLKEHVGQYIFVSSISAYADFSQVGIGEEAPVGELDDPTSEDVRKNYGALKALCEEEVQSAFQERALIIRPGLIVGPHDPTDRFTYWVRRYWQEGDILVPEPQNAAVQFIDVRDLSEWIIRLAEQRTSGVFNATGPHAPLTMSEVVEELQTLGSNTGQEVWVDEAFLLEKGVREFLDLPLWISEKTGWPGFMTVNHSRALENGLTYRPLHETILDTQLWDQERNKSEGLKAGLTTTREAELLQAWETVKAKG